MRVKRYLKKGLFLSLIILSFLLQGCGYEEKYSKAWIEKNVDLSTDNKMILVEDDTSEMVSAGVSGIFFMEYGNFGNDWLLRYNIGGYELGYYCIGEEQIGILNYAEELERYNIEGDMSESKIADDVSVIKDLFNIDFKKAKLEIHEDSDDGLAVVSLTAKEKVTVLFLDKETNECRRIEVGIKDDSGKVNELFLAVPTPVKEITFPEGIDEIEKVDDIDSDKFSKFCSRFVFSSLVNTSYNLGLDSSDTEEK